MHACMHNEEEVHGWTEGQMRLGKVLSRGLVRSSGLCHCSLPSPVNKPRHRDTEMADTQLHATAVVSSCLFFRSLSSLPSSLLFFLQTPSPSSPSSPLLSKRHARTHTQRGPSFLLPISLPSLFPVREFVHRAQHRTAPSPCFFHLSFLCSLPSAPSPQSKKKQTHARTQKKSCHSTNCFASHLPILPTPVCFHISLLRLRLLLLTFFSTPSTQSVSQPVSPSFIAVPEQRIPN